MITLLEFDLDAGGFLRLLGFQQHFGDVRVPHRRGNALGPDEIADAAGALDHKPGFLRNTAVFGRLHFHEHVARIQFSPVDRLSTGPDALDLFGRHLNPADGLGQTLLLDFPLEGLLDLHFLVCRNS